MMYVNPQPLGTTMTTTTPTHLAHDNVVDNALRAFQNKRAVIETLSSKLDPLNVANFDVTVKDVVVVYEDTLNDTTSGYNYLRTEVIIPLTFGFLRIDWHTRLYKGSASCYVTYSYNIPSFGRHDQLLYKNRIERSVTVDMMDGKMVSKLEKKIKSLVEGVHTWYDAGNCNHFASYGMVFVSVSGNDYNTWRMHDTYAELERLRLRIAITVNNHKTNPQLRTDVDAVAMLDGITKMQEMFYKQSRGPKKFTGGIYL
jgi:hypothetical protein